MTEHEEWMEQMHSLLEDRIAELRMDFMKELLTYADQQGYEEIHYDSDQDVFPSTPPELWTAKMHDIYGQSRAYNTIADFIGSRGQDDAEWLLLKPHLLGPKG